MFRRTLNVVFRPMKNNYVLLPDSYYRILSTYVSKNFFFLISWSEGQ